MGDYVLDATVFLNVQRLSAGTGTQSASVTQAVTEAEMKIRAALAESTNGATIPTLVDTPATPEIIQLIALWEASTLALAKIFGGEGKEDTTSVGFWSKRAERGIQRILGGHIRLVFATGNVGPAAQDFDTNKEPEDSPDGTYPVRKYLGKGQDGEYIETDSRVEDQADIDYDGDASWSG